MKHLTGQSWCRILVLVLVLLTSAFESRSEAAQKVTMKFSGNGTFSNGTTSTYSGLLLYEQSRPATPPNSGRFPFAMSVYDYALSYSAGAVQEQSTGDDCNPFTITTCLVGPFTMQLNATMSNNDQVTIVLPKLATCSRSALPVCGAFKINVVEPSYSFKVVRGGLTFTSTSMTLTSCNVVIHHPTPIFEHGLAPELRPQLAGTTPHWSAVSAPTLALPVTRNCGMNVVRPRRPPILAATTVPTSWRIPPRPCCCLKSLLTSCKSRVRPC